MATVAQDYLRPSFKGIEFPAITWGLGFSHELGDHKFLFKDEHFQQPQGRTNITWSAQISLSQNNKSIPDLFVKTFPELFVALSDSEPGDLVTPDLGTFRAACVSVSYQLTAQQQDGVTVDVQFVHAPSAESFESDIAINPSVTQASNFADQLEEEYVVVMGEEPAKPSPKSLYDSLKTIGDQIELASDIVDAKFGAIIYSFRAMSEQVEGLLDVNNWGLVAKLRQAELEAMRAKRSITGGGSGSAGGPLRYLVLNESSIDEVASDLRVSMESLIRLNPGLAASPIIPENTEIKFVLGK